jgi:hypothetical protein
MPDEISGQVTENGSPVENAVVVAVKQESPVTLSQTQASEADALAKLTDVNGQYTFEPGELFFGTEDYHIIVRKDAGTPRRGQQNFPFIEGVRRTPDAVRIEDLVAWYRFEDGDARDYASDSEFRSISWPNPAGFDGSLNGTTIQPTGGVVDIEFGRESGSARFDGNNDVITTSAQPLQTTEFTIMGWVRPNNTQVNQLIAGQDDFATDGTFDKRYSILLPGSSNKAYRIQVNTGNGFNISDFGTVRTTEFTHVAMRFDGFEAVGYENGIPKASLSENGDCITGYEFRMGAPVDPGSAFLDGEIDGVRLYNRALSDSDILEIYENTEPEI